MSLFSRRAVLFLPALIAACGFEPVYAPGGSGSVLQNNLLVDEPDAVDGYLLTRRIEERVGRAGNPAFRLGLTVSTVQEDLGVDAQGDITRFNILGVANYTLIDVNSGRIVTSGSVDNFTGYSATGTTIATLAAERDARQRLMIILGDQIVSRLLVADVT